jgi:hypothetical protein
VRRLVTVNGSADVEALSTAAMGMHPISCIELDVDLMAGARKTENQSLKKNNYE